MVRVFILLLLLTFFLHAEAFRFKEERYLYALDKTVTREGTIRFSSGGLEILYDQGGQSLLYYKDKLVVVKGTQRKVLDLNRDPVMKTFFMLLEAIFYDDSEKLERFFALKARKSERLLLPKGPLSAKLDKVVYRKRKHLDYLRIYLKNGDRISIEETQ